MEKTENTENLSHQRMKAMRTRARLLDAAAKLFAENSFDSVGVRDIAAAADTTTGAFYHYFSGKDDILDAIYQSRDINFKEILDSISAETNSYAEEIIKFFSDVLAKRAESDGKDFGKHRMFHMQKHSTDRDRLYKASVELIQKAIDAGEFKKKYSTKKINEYLFLVFRGTLYEWLITPDSESFDLKDAVRDNISTATRAFV